jgi:hypothetical protein
MYIPKNPEFDQNLRKKTFIFLHMVEIGGKNNNIEGYLYLNLNFHI